MSTFSDCMPCQLRDIRAWAHPNCVVCAPSNAVGLGLIFHATDDGGVEATFGCSRQFEGYAKVLHGGVIASILDGAMTNCLFAHGLVAVTAELKIRFRHQVAVDVPATIRAWIPESHGRLHQVKAQLVQESQVKVVASGKFMEQPGAVGSGGGPT